MIITIITKCLCITTWRLELWIRQTVIKLAEYCRLKKLNTSYLGDDNDHYDDNRSLLTGWHKIQRKKQKLFSGLPLTQVLESIPWVRCVSGNVFAFVAHFEVNFSTIWTKNLVFFTPTDPQSVVPFVPKILRPGFFVTDIHEHKLHISSNWMRMKNMTIMMTIRTMMMVISMRMKKMTIKWWWWARKEKWTRGWFYLLEISVGLWVHMEGPEFIKISSLTQVCPTSMFQGKSTR